MFDWKLFFFVTISALIESFLCAAIDSPGLATQCICAGVGFLFSRFFNNFLKVEKKTSRGYNEGKGERDRGSVSERNEWALSLSLNDLWRRKADLTHSCSHTQLTHFFRIFIEITSATFYTITSDENFKIICRMMKRFRHYRKVSLKNKNQFSWNTRRSLAIVREKCIFRFLVFYSQFTSWTF